MNTYFLWGIPIQSTEPLPHLHPETSEAKNPPLIVTFEQKTSGFLPLKDDAPYYQQIGDQMNAFASSYDEATQQLQFQFIERVVDEMAIVAEGAADLQQRTLHLHIHPQRSPEDPAKMQHALAQMATSILKTHLMPYALRLWGDLCLHGPTIQAKTGGIALLADSGYGKSTLALACQREGYPILSDDLTRLTFADEIAFAHAGSQLIRVENDLEPRFLTQQYATMPLAISHQTNTYLVNELSAQWLVQPVQAVFELLDYEDREAVRLEKVTTQEAAIRFYRHIRGRYLPVPPTIRKREFALCAELARRIPLYGVHRPRGYDWLEGTVRAIMARA